MLVDSGSDIDLVNQTVFTELKPKFGKISKQLSVKTVKGFAIIKDYLLLELQRSDGKYIKCHFYHCPDLPCNYLISNRTLHRIGLELKIEDKLKLEKQNKLNKILPENNSPNDLILDIEDNDSVFLNGINIHRHSLLNNPTIQDFEYNSTQQPNPKCRQLANALVNEFKDLIPTDDWDVGAIPNYKYRINLKENFKDFNIKTRHFNPKQTLDFQK